MSKTSKSDYLLQISSKSDKRFYVSNTGITMSEKSKNQACDAA